MKSFLLVALLAGIVRAADITFNSTLEGDGGTGSFDGSLDTVASPPNTFTLTVTLSWDDFTATGADFRSTDTEVPIFSTSETSPFTGDITLDLDQAGDLTKGNYAINIQSDANPDGAVTGTVVFVMDPADRQIVIDCDDADNCLRVGFSYPGDPDTAQSDEGNDMLHGYKYWAWKANGDGGIPVGGVDMEIQLVSFNDHNFQPLANVYYDEMINGGTQFDFLFGPFGTSFTDEALDAIVENNRAVLFANSASETTFNNDYGRQFGLMTTAAEYTVSILNELGSPDHEARTAGVLRVISDFTGSVYQGALEHAFQNTIAIIHDEIYLPGQNTDFKPQLQRIRDLNPDIIMSFSFQGDAPQIVADAHTIGLLGSSRGSRAFFMTSAPSMPSFVDEVGDQARWLLGPTQWHSSLDFEDAIFGSAGDFSDAFKSFCDETLDPPNTCAEGDPSDNVAGPAATGLVLQMALAESESSNEDEVVDILHKMFEEPIETFYGLIQFDERGHNAAKQMIVTQIMESLNIEVVAPDEHSGGTEVVYPIPGTGKKDESMIQM